MRNKAIALVLAIMMVFLLCSCAEPTTQGDNGGNTQETNDNGVELIKIGVVAPMTGPIAADGKYVREGVEIALSELDNNTIELDNGSTVKVKIVYEDTEAKPDVATNAYRKLIEQDKVCAIVGPNVSTCMLAAGPVAQEAGVTNIGTTATNPRTSDIGDCMFRMCFTDDFQGRILGQYLAETLGLKTCAILYNNASEYSTGLTETFQEFYKQFGGEIVEVQAYNGLDVKDFNVQLTTIKSKNPEVIFYPNTAPECGLQFTQTRNNGITSLMVGSDGCDTPELLEIAGADILEGVVYVSPFYAGDPSPLAQQFVTKYRDSYGYDPSFHGVLGYEAVQVVFEAIRKTGGGERAAIRDAVNALENFELPSGAVSWDENRNPIKGAYIMEWSGGEKIFIEKIQPE